MLRGVANDWTTNHRLARGGQRLDYQPPPCNKEIEVMKNQLGQSHCFKLRGVANDRTTNYLLIIKNNEDAIRSQLRQSHIFKSKVYCTILHCT